MSFKSDTIHFILTGGTIDSFYNATLDTPTPRDNSIIPRYIHSLKLHKKIEFTEICMKDSRKLSHKDLKNIVKTIEQSPYKKFIITHGTYTMPDTARFLKKHVSVQDKTIILTGAMIPLDGFTLSDAGFNLGYSMASIKSLSSGIFVCMNGKLFTPEEVVKVVEKGRFDSLFSKEK